MTGENISDFPAEMTVGKPNKKYKELKGKQKERIAEWMYNETAEFYRAHNRLPNEEEELTVLAESVYSKIKEHLIWISYEAFLSKFRNKIRQYKKKKRFERESAPFISETKKPKKKKRKKSDSGKKKNPEPDFEWPFDDDQDETYFYIAGYTFGGAPYGITWEEMGISPGDNETLIDDTPF